MPRDHQNLTGGIGRKLLKSLLFKQIENDVYTLHRLVESQALKGHQDNSLQL